MDPYWDFGLTCPQALELLAWHYHALNCGHFDRDRDRATRRRLQMVFRLQRFTGDEPCGNRPSVSNVSRVEGVETTHLAMSLAAHEAHRLRDRAGVLSRHRHFMAAIELAARAARIERQARWG